MNRFSTNVIDTLDLVWCRSPSQGLCRCSFLLEHRCTIDFNLEYHRRPQLLSNQVKLTANWRHLAVVQTSWSCQSKCQRLRATLLLHNFPLSWNMSNMSTGLFMVLNLFTELLSQLWSFYCCYAVSALRSNTRQAYKSAILWQMQFENSSGHICSIPDEGKVLYSKRTKLTELGVAKCYPLNPWNPPNLSLKKGKHLSATKILSTGY